MLTTMYKQGIFDIKVPVSINNEEAYISGTPNISKEIIKDYLDRINEFYDSNYYDLDKVLDENEEFIPPNNEKILRIFGIKDEDEFSFADKNDNGEYGIVTYKPLLQDEICVVNS